MSVIKSKKSEVFSYFKKATGEFLARSHINYFFKELHLGICVNASACTLERTHERDNRLVMFRALCMF